MRRLSLVLCLLAPCAAQGQSLPIRDAMPREVQRAFEGRWNGPNVIRSSDSVAIARRVEGNVAVQNGPLVVDGHVTGNVVAVNSDVILRAGARIDGDLWVAGGGVRGREPGTIGGEVRVYERRVVARRDADNLFIESDEEAVPAHSLGRRPVRLGGERTWSDAIHLASAGAYNRVEGLPINLGPSIYQQTGRGSFSLDAFAVLRTGSTFGSEGDVGHDVSSEIRFSQRTGPAIGGRWFNVIDPVESWQLSNIETSLAAFVVRRDYRDYFENRGLSGYGRFYLGRSASLTATYSDQRWGSRSLFNPFTLFRAAADWRENPRVEEGPMHVGNLTLKYDTRTNPDQPQSGFFVLVDAERGAGDLAYYPNSFPIAFDSAASVGVTSTRHADYTRAFVDLRSYNRISPSGQITFRVVGAGWIGGDSLPLQRRLSVEGSSVLPGFDFRDNTGGFHPGTCSSPLTPGKPANCDRIALGQVEYRGTVHIDFGDWREDAGRYIGARSEASWVVFLDAGRGWMVGENTGDQSHYPAAQLPPISSFRSDFGLGFDFGGIGLYAAKAISKSSEPMNVFLRLHRRF